MVYKSASKISRIVFLGTAFAVASWTTIFAVNANANSAACDQVCTNKESITVRATKIVPGKPGKQGSQKSGVPPSAKGKVSRTPTPAELAEPGLVELNAEFKKILCSGAFRGPKKGCEPKKTTPPAPAPTPVKPVPPTAPQLMEVVKRLPLVRPVLSMQPDGHPALVNMPQILFTTTPPTQTLRTELFGEQVTVHTSTIDYKWIWGDGTITHSKDPGKEYPEETVSHPYEQRGTYTLSLRVTITGTYTGSDGVEHPIPGTATLTSAPRTLTVIERHTRLITPQ